MKKLESRSCAVAFLACGAGLLLLLSPTAARGEAKYKRLTSISVEQTEATKKLQVKPKEEKKQAVPELSADQFFQIEGAVQDIYEEKLNELQEIINDTEDDDPEKPELIFRLAMTRAEKQRFYHFMAMEALSKKDRTNNAKELAKLDVEYKKATADENKWLVQTVKAYKLVVDNPTFVKYPRMDEALFYYAFTLGQAKYDDQALKYYRRLVKEHPDSKFIPEAYL
ncbi:MAG: hypothetical protein V2A73_05820, partial [Pseudomonadota bacterium]